MAPQLTAKLKGEYQLLYESCLIRPERLAEIDAIVKKLKANRKRYQAVAKPLGMPWYAVGLIHGLEASFNFGAHLHNGDPLNARTTRVPAGRPKAGAPPFTWEQSAADALAYQGFGSWKDWSVPGILFKLESYNGWGYRQYHPDVPSPYLWSFSNHYKRGKYVGDGDWSATTVSAQCGAAVVLKRLNQSDGAVQVDAGPRGLQLSNPLMVGPDVEEAQRLLLTNQFGVFDPGGVDGEFGTITANAVRAAKWALGYPEKNCDRCFGPVLKAYLDGSKALPAAFQTRREQRLVEAATEPAIRAKIVEWALWGVKNCGQISYSQGATRLGGLTTPGRVPLATDCSAFATMCYAWAEAPNPNMAGPYDPAKGGYTGTLLEHCRRIPRAAVQPGDLVVWSPPPTGQHVCVVVSKGADPWLVSHGDDTGPKKLRFSAEHAWQAGQGHGTVTWLSVF
jgi:lysozyme family protein